MILYYYNRGSESGSIYYLLTCQFDDRLSVADADGNRLVTGFDHVAIDSDNSGNWDNKGAVDA